MIVREATESDWDRIWPIFHEIAAAGETYAYPREISKEAAKKLWMYYFVGRPVVVLAGLPAIKDMLNSEFEPKGGELFFPENEARLVEPLIAGLQQLPGVRIQGITDPGALSRRVP